MGGGPDIMVWRCNYVRFVDDLWTDGLHGAAEGRAG